MSKLVTVPISDELFLNEIPFLDVRAPIEFKAGKVPNATNIPLLDDSEREIIGTTYKNEGQESAIALGYEIVSGINKETKINAWKELAIKLDNLHLYCFRGGMRSQVVATWLKEIGLDIPYIEGGYKNIRSYLSKRCEELLVTSEFQMLSGRTGSGKTVFLQEIADRVPVIDLEEISYHWGSAFGNRELPQPAQPTFENDLAIQFLKVSKNFPNRPILIEDESRMIGKIVLNPNFYEKMRSSSIIHLDVTVEDRAKHILDQYILTPLKQNHYEDGIQELASHFEKSLNRISKKLGGARTKECMDSLTHATTESLNSGDFSSHLEWISALLIYYYDPLYDRGIKKKKGHIIHSGSYNDLKDFILNH